MRYWWNVINLKVASNFEFKNSNETDLFGSQTALEICARYLLVTAFHASQMGIRSIPAGSLWYTVPLQATILFYRPCVLGNIILDNTGSRSHRQRRRAYQNDFWYTYRELWAHRSSTYGTLPRDRKLVVRWARMGTPRNKRERGRKKGCAGEERMVGVKKNYRVDRNTHMQKARRGRGRSEGA